MTEDMRKLLRDASDDGGRPVGFAIEELVVRGRRRVRTRRSGFGAVAGVAAASLAAGVLAAWPSGESDRGPAFSTSDDDELIELCAEMDDVYREVSGNGDSEPIGDWSVKVRQADDKSISMMLAPHDQREYAYCRLDLTGDDVRDDYWRGPYASILDAAAEGAEIGDGRVVWSSGGTMSEKIGRMTYETADGEVTEAARNGRYYVWQHDTTDVDPGEPVWVRFYYVHNGEFADRIRAKDTIYSSEYPDLPPAERNTDLWGPSEPLDEGEQLFLPTERSRR